MKDYPMIRDQLLINLSWRVMCEVMRHAPGRFILLESHPCGGMYDCLGLKDQDNRHFVDFNRCGRIHFMTIFQGGALKDNGGVEPIDYIREIEGGASTQDIVEKICKTIGLPVHKQLPPGDTSVLMMRYISAFLSHSVHGKHQWNCVNGTFDSSGPIGSSWQGSMYAAFSGAVPARGAYHGDYCPRFSADSHFWFLCQDGEPRLCLATDGRLFDRQGNICHLLPLYKELGRNIWRVVIQTAAAEMKG